MAYADYLDLISLTQQLLSGMAASLSSAKALDLFPSNAPFKQVDFVDELVSATGQTFPTGDDLNVYAVAGPFLRDLCSKFDIPTKSDRGEKVKTSRVQEEPPVPFCFQMYHTGPLKHTPEHMVKVQWCLDLVNFDLVDYFCYLAGVKNGQITPW